MSDAYDKISKLWCQFPKDLENSTLYDEVNNLKTTFENRKYIFDDYLTKIVIIGKVSTGKSTLINALLGKEYFGTTMAHGTISFFYCSLSQKDYEYFTINNCCVEHKDFSILNYATKLNVPLPDFFDEKSVLKVYIKHDESKILESKTVIVDCPGLGYDEKYDKEIENHCSNADMFIFMFEINEPATLNQRNYITTIRDNFKNPTFFFVYNKCDLPEFNDEEKSSLMHDFTELFGKLYFRNLKINKDPLYFISAKNPNNFEDFNRLKEDIMNHKKVNTNRCAYVQAKLLDEADNFCNAIKNLLSKEREIKISESENIDKLKRQTRRVYENYSGFQDYVKRCIENCENNLQINKIFDLILRIIVDSKQTCTKETAVLMITKIETNITNEVIEFIRNHLNKVCIEPINKKILEINNDNPTGITMNNDIDYNLSSDELKIPQYDNIKNIFWFFETKDKTAKVKEAYVEFVQKSNKNQINESLINFYKSEFAKIEDKYYKLVECTKKKHENQEKFLNENLQRLENKLEFLSNYENEINEIVKSFKSSFV